ncbi:MAG: FMN-binding protein [Spartobacteria bacterium]|nr:FMN-binding protein [Spartobacteria bacterium]
MIQSGILFFRRWGKLIWGVAVFFLFGWHLNDVAIVNQQSERIVAPVSSALISIGTSFFPNASTVLSHTNDWSWDDVVDEGGQLLGYILTGPAPDARIRGYAGAVPIAVGISEGGRVTGVRFLANRETPGFVRRVASAGLLKRWDGMSITGIPEKVDAVSGATYTSMAVIRGVEDVLSRASQVLPSIAGSSSGSGADDSSTYEWFDACIALAGFAMAGLRYKKPVLFSGVWLFAYRVLIIGVFGVVLQSMLSMAVLAGWLREPEAALRHGAVLCMAGLTLVVGLLSGKNIYCRLLCPYGQAQDVAASLVRHRPSKSPQWMRRLFSWLRLGVISWVAISLWFGFVCDYSALEPFTAFHPGSASIGSLVLGAGFLLVSIFYPRLWCASLCPTGWLVRLLTIRSSRKGA